MHRVKIDSGIGLPKDNAHGKCVGADSGVDKGHVIVNSHVSCTMFFFGLGLWASLVYTL
jgi:hypothetical protein